MPSLLQSGTCYIDQCGCTHTHTRTHHLRTSHLFDGIHPFTNCTVVRFSNIPFCADNDDLCVDSGDLCEADDSKLVTARLRVPNRPVHFSEASHVTKTVFFLPAFLLKVKGLQPFPLNLVEYLEVDDNDFCEQTGR